MRVFPVLVSMDSSSHIGRMVTCLRFVQPSIQHKSSIDLPHLLPHFPRRSSHIVPADLPQSSLRTSSQTLRIDFRPLPTYGPLAYITLLLPYHSILRSALSIRLNLIPEFP
jgi:hypothetical protein